MSSVIVGFWPQTTHLDCFGRSLIVLKLPYNASYNNKRCENVSFEQLRKPTKVMYVSDARRSK